MLIRVYSYLLTIGASTLSPVEKVHSSLLEVKISMPVTMALADPCFPVLAVEKSTTLQGLPLIITREPFLREPAAVFSIPAEPASP